MSIGNTNSYVGVFQNEEIRILNHELSNKFVPSVVSFQNSGIFVGESALPFLYSDPVRTIYDIPHLLGKRFLDSKIQENLINYPFEIVENEEGYCSISINIHGRKSLHSMEEIYSLIVKKLKEKAESFLSHKVNKAAVSFSGQESQMESIRRGYEKGGLEIVEMKSEAELALLGKEIKDINKTLVFDVGGTSIKATIFINDENGGLKIDWRDEEAVGGKNFTQSVLNFFLEDFEKRSGKNPRENPQSVQKITKEVEKAMVSLSISVETWVYVPNFFEGSDFGMYLSRTKFEEINRDSFTRISQFADKLKDVEVDTVLIIGGASKTPRIQKIMQDLLPGKTFVYNVRPEESVVLGTVLRSKEYMNGMGIFKDPFEDKTLGS